MTIHSSIAETNDNRRAIVRIMGYEILRGLVSLARVSGGDLIQLMVFTGIWTANTQHLVTERNRYKALRDIPPDSQRRPIPEDVLAEQIAMPPDIVNRYVEPMIAAGLVERLAGGLVVPSAVFRRDEMLDGSNELYGRVVGMISALRAVGFQFGDDA